MYNSLSGVVGALPAHGHGIPPEMQVLVNWKIVSEMPTLMLVLRGPTAIYGTNVFLYPVHALVLIYHCSKLAELSVFRRAPSTTPGTLSTVQFHIPCPDQFGIILEYLYTKNVNALLGRLAIPQNASRQMLINQAQLISGLWMNGRVLGLHDDVFYATLQQAWMNFINRAGLGSTCIPVPLRSNVPIVIRK